MTEELQTLSLSELRETLKQRGVEIGLSSLSEMVKEGDIAEQLEAQRQGNKLCFRHMPSEAAGWNEAGAILWLRRTGRNA